MGMYAADYEVTYRDARVKLKEHIGYGVSTEPRHTIRLAFFFDEASRKVIVCWAASGYPKVELKL